MKSALPFLFLASLLLSPGCGTSPSDTDQGAEPITAPKLDADAGSTPQEPSAEDPSKLIVPSSRSTVQETRFIDLFDGRSTDGWAWEPYAQGSNAPSPLSVEAGVLVNKGLPAGLLRHHRSAAAPQVCCGTKGPLETSSWRSST